MPRNYAMPGLSSPLQAEKTCSSMDQACAFFTENFLDFHAAFHGNFYVISRSISRAETEYTLISRYLYVFFFKNGYIERCNLKLQISSVEKEEQKWLFSAPTTEVFWKIIEYLSGVLFSRRPPADDPTK